MPGTNRSGGNRVLGDDSFPLDSLPKPSKKLPVEQSAVWDSLMEQLPAEMLRSIDSYQLAILVELIVRERKLAILCRTDLDLKLARAHLQTVQQIGRMSAMFGMSPLDRRRIKISTPEEASAFSELLARMGGKGNQN